MAIIFTYRRSKLNADLRVDAEFYQPQYIKTENRLKQIPHRKLGRIVSLVTQGPNPFFTKTGYICLNGRSIANGRVDYQNCNYVSKKEFEKLSKFHVKRDDILITLKGLGSIGKIGFVFDEKPAVFSRDVGIIRIDHKRVASAAVYVYLISRFGAQLIERGVTGGTGQRTLTTSYLKGLLYPKLGIESKLASLAYASESSLLKAQKLYAEAEQLLLSQLGLSDRELKHALIFVRRYSEAVRAQRMDAEHFQPKYDELLRIIENRTKCKPLSTICPFIEHGKQPPYVEHGEVFVFSQKYIGEQTIDYNFPNDSEVKRTSNDFAAQHQKFVLKEQDILHYSVGANIGFCQPYLEPEIKAMPGSFITLIRADEKKINPLYLAVLLNSMVGRFQTDKWKSATAQPYIYPKDIRNFLIPLIQPEHQNSISVLIKDAHAARKRAIRLLGQAKRAVEIALEEGEEQAMASFQ